MAYKSPAAYCILPKNTRYVIFEFLSMTDRVRTDIHTHVHKCIQCTHTWMGVHSETGFYKKHVLLYSSPLIEKSPTPSYVRCTSLSDLRCVSLFGHRCGTLEGWAEGPEKPAAWNYCFPPGPAFRKDNWASVESPPLYSPPPAEQPDSTDTAQLRAHRAASACY